MELGTIQKAWIADLRKHSIRQLTTGQLGFKDGKKIRVCCLGQGLLTICNIENTILPFSTVDHDLKDFDGSAYYLHTSWEKLGLNNAAGKFNKDVEIKNAIYSDLSSMNDEGMTWKQIANYIEANPENVFTKSV